MEAARNSASEGVETELEKLVLPHGVSTPHNGLHPIDSKSYRRGAEGTEEYKSASSAVPNLAFCEVFVPTPIRADQAGQTCAFQARPNTLWRQLFSQDEN
jgi:hypothetical protein